MSNNSLFTWSTPPVDKSVDDHGYTRSQSALYAQVSLSGQTVGLCQNIRWEGQSGNAPVNGIGEPWSENKPGQTFFQVTIGNFSVRKARLLDMTAAAYQNVVTAQNQQNINLDFRTLPFDLYLNFGYKSASGTTIENSAEILHGLWLQTWSGEWSDPQSLRMEGLTGWAMGYSYLQQGGSQIYTMGNTPNTWIPGGEASSGAEQGSTGGSGSGAEH